MPDTKVLTMAGDIKVVVFDSIDQITTYVLEEQNDWFEDEIKFVRKLLKPGQTVLDIGANLGVYTLTMASLVGEKGRVIAFEPSSSTAALLKQSVQHNNFKHVEVDSRAMGAKQGKALITMSKEPEYNQIEVSKKIDDGDNESHESIEMTSLDEWAAEVVDAGSISFIKLDAEGQELNIIKGGNQFLKSQSPLILYEIKHGMEVHLELVEELANLGYKSYYLIPDQNILVPFDNTPDEYLLNFSAAKMTLQNGLKRNRYSCVDLSQKSKRSPAKSITGNSLSMNSPTPLR